MTARKAPTGDFRHILERLAYGHDTRRVFDAFRPPCNSRSLLFSSRPRDSIRGSYTQSVALIMLRFFL